MTEHVIPGIFDGPPAAEASEPTERVISASDIDLHEVARIMCGEIREDGERTQVVWGDFNMYGLEWSPVRISDRLEGETLTFRQVDDVRTGLEVCGLVETESLIAFVYPSDDSRILIVDVMSRNGVSRLIESEEVFSEPFLKAKAIADENLAELRASNSPS